MYFYRPLILATALCATLTGLSHASEFDSHGSASPELVAIQPTSNFVFVLGMGIGTAPAYEGASEYGATFTPIIKVERLLIPGLIDIGGQGDTRGGFKFSPSFGVVGERNSDDYEPLQGLDDIDATYALGARVGYEVVLNETMSAEIYGAARYAFGGAEGLVGEAGVDVTARLTPQLEIIGGPVVNFATSSYMDTYFGVTSAESAATGGRLDTFDPSGGIKSVGVNLAARYEFMPDTFVNLNGSYTTYVGDARQSPIVQSGSQHQFTATLGLSRRFAF